jgi:CMP-N-acetylneuraminic acid synthetase
VSPRAVGLIPARAGSKRVPGKNVRVLNGHPMLAYTIAPAIESGIFESVIVSTDSEEIAAVARHYGAEVPFLRPPRLATDTSPDIEWITYTLAELRRQGRTWDSFSLLRPTSPFRTPETIRRAWQTFTAREGIDSLRAVERCAQHPGKMWIVQGDRMFPLLPFGLVPPKSEGEDGGLASPKPPGEGGQPWHSTPYQALPTVYMQNASLEIAWTRVVFERGTIAGDVIAPFLTEGYEGFDINDAKDLIVAERLVADGTVQLPKVRHVPYGVTV